MRVKEVQEKRLDVGSCYSSKYLLKYHFRCLGEQLLEDFANQVKLGSTLYRMPQQVNVV